MGAKVFLCASEYPRREQSLKSIGIDVTESIDGFVKAIGRNEILPFLGAYQRMAYSYFFFKKLLKKYTSNFVFVSGGSTIIPKNMAERTIVYVHFPMDLEIASKDYLSSRLKRIYIKPWRFISNNLDYIKKATIITNSSYTKSAIKTAWGIDAKVIYPPCPQYSFPLNDRKEDHHSSSVCSLGRFTPEKKYETMLEVAKKLPDVSFHLVGSVTPDKKSYLERLMNMASGNVVFHVNASIQEKIDVLCKSKVMLHSFVGEHFGIAIIEAMSAGVIPVTHDSGAAKVDGLVPESYRYHDVNSAVGKVTSALSSWDLNVAERLREFAKGFSADSFRENLKRFLLDWINRHP